MWGEMERSPALAAPGSNNYCNVANRSTGHIDGKTAKKNQALSDAQFELVKNYLPLAYSLTRGYHGKGQSHEELRAGAENGLLGAAINFDPNRGSHFAAYARPWIKGGITALFKKKKADKATDTTDSIEEDIPAPVEPLTVDLQSLSDREQRIVVGRAGGESLKEVGDQLGVSAERVRQIENSRNGKASHQQGQDCPCVYP